MGFIMKGAPYFNDNTPIYSIDMENGVLGKANNNGTIVINKDIKDPKQIDDVIEHEKIHIDQMKRGDLDYDDNNVYWKGKMISAPIWDMEKEDLVDGVEVMMASTFLFEAEGAKMSFSY